MTFTKRQYLAEIAANEAALIAVRSELSAFADRSEAGEPIDAIGDAWNAAYDREYALEQDRHGIEYRWSTRKWTHSDRVFAELVSANID